MDYKNYQQARDMSWRMLIKCNIMSVPVQVVHVCKQNGWSVYTYRAMHDYLQKTGLLQYSQTTDGFTLRMHGNYAIFVDDTMSSERQRFTIAHEIGHIVCGHLQDGGRTVICREPAATDSPQERQANIFASRFLAPACVLEELHCTTPEAIAKLCKISITAARFRAERMQILHKRQAFYLSPLERQVRAQFADFIMHYGS